MVTKENAVYIISCVITALVLLVSLFYSALPYLVLLLCAVLVFVFTLRSLLEKESLWLTLMGIVASLLLCGISGTFVSGILLSETRYHNKPIWRVIILPIAAILSGMGNQEKPVYIMLHTLFLLIGTLLIIALEYVLNKYLSAKEKMKQAILYASIGEMREKKLNSELSLKHYLADKNARLQERENISRSIHNNVGHSITAAVMALDAADMLFEASPERAREKVNTANERIRESLTSIRRAVRVLDEDTTPISVGDLCDEMVLMADNFMMDTNIKVKCNLNDVDRSLPLPHQHTEFLLGALGETLTNGVRHGKADLFYVAVFCDSGHIQFKVRDNGTSDFSRENRDVKIQNGFGLKKIMSYAKNCGGTASFANDNGFETEIILPLEVVENE